MASFQDETSASISVQRAGDILRQSSQLLKGTERRSSGRHDSKSGQRHNVSEQERVLSVAAGSMLALLGLRRRDLTGLVIAGAGGAMLLRGTTGHCAVYQMLGIDTARDRQHGTPRSLGTQVRQSFLINKTPNELYSFWKNFENFPQFMSHLESVQKLDERRSHWVAKAPSIYGGKVEWDAELTADEPDARIAWRVLPGADIEHRGEVRFTKALGDRGTNVRVELDYQPPLGQIGRWLAKLFGEEPEVQIREDLRKFQRIMECGELPTIVGQSHGTCTGKGERYNESA